MSIFKVLMGDGIPGSKTFGTVLLRRLPLLVVSIIYVILMIKMVINGNRGVFHGQKRVILREPLFSERIVLYLVLQPAL